MKLIFATFLIFTFQSCSAQLLIQGSYREKNAVGKASHIMIFKNGTFEERFNDDLQISLGSGTYSIKNNNLILAYKPYPKQNSSSYQLFDAVASNNIKIELSVFDSDTIPMFAYYGLRDYKNEAVNVIHTDKNGSGNMSVYNSKNIGYFTIDAIGYHRILIPIKKLINTRVKIKAYLKPQKEIYIEAITEIYKVVKFTDEELTLNKKGVLYIFEKIK